jgi:eukaryotic-like serine/threonine-protein kinase
VSTGENLELLRTLFELSLEQPDSERDAWLQRQCAASPDMLARLRRMLAQRQKPAGILANDAAALLGRLLPAEDAVDDVLGGNIGPYRMSRMLGEGGMGRVYLAERVDGQFHHQVALKLIRSEFATPELHQRFLRERDTLARLAHPNIAQLHDGGISAKGAPYFTLEFIEGEPITRWCDAQRLGIPARLRLLLKVCDAVQYAHRNLIVHRDLKPSNIMVTANGEPKLLDFGIAKPLTGNTDVPELTGTQATPMTREYAAPEQLLGDPVTTATDVYGLGVLLYLLLCGQMPYRRAALGQTSWTKAILEEAPEPLERALRRTDVHTLPHGPSSTDAASQYTHASDALALAAARDSSPQSLQRSLRGDLDRIVQRALAKPPEARYATVSAMADDMRAFLDGRPLSGGTRTYKMRKFVRRHWLPLAAASALLIVVILSATGIVWQAARIEREAKTTAVVKDFLIGLFTAVDPHEAKGKNITARELLDRGKKNIEDKPPDDPAVKGELQSVLGRIDFQLGLYAEASDLQQRAIDSFRAGNVNQLQLAHTELDRAETLRSSGELKTASEMVNAADVHLRQIRQAPVSERIRLLMLRSGIAIAMRKFDESKPDADAALILARQSKTDVSQLEFALLNAGNAEWGRKALDAAEAHYREALALALRRQGPEGLMVSSLRANIALVLAGRSRYAEALAEMQQSIDIDTKMLGPEHPSTLNGTAAAGTFNYNLGHYRKAREMLDQVYAAQRRTLGADSPALAGTLINLGLTLVQIPDLDAAEHAFAEAESIWENKYGTNFKGIDVARGALGYVHMLQGRLDLADRELTEVVAADEKRGEKDDFETYDQLGELARLRGNFGLARQWDERALKAAQNEGGENFKYTAAAHHYLGLALRDNNDPAAAEHEFRAALASFAGYIAQAEHPLAATTRYELGLLLIKRDGTRADGIRLLAEATDLREKFLGADEPRTKQAREALLKAKDLAKN